jgi:hypothetical protein
MTTEQLLERLAMPFAADEVKWKPQAVKGNRALAVCYIDARLVMDRLDEVFGVGGWKDEYTPLNNGAVLCQLSAKVGGEWVSRQDVGSESEQPDEHDRCKAAFSDALKRAAVKFGIGRYLYRLGHQWCDYDPVKKQFAGRPQLPKWALPGPVVHNAQLPAYPEKQPEALPAADRKPLWDDDDAFFAKLQQAGRAWPKVVQWINDKHGGKYKPDTGFFDMSEQHRKIAAEAMMGGK